MKRFVCLALLIALCGYSVGCASLNPSTAMQQWNGRTSQQLILQWGPPMRSTTDGAGGEVLVYEYWRPRQFVPYVGWIGGYSASRMFYVNSDGVIYNWRWQGI
jgi:hypothetical protein